MFVYLNMCSDLLIDKMYILYICILEDGFKDYLCYVAQYSLFDPNTGIIYEKSNPYKHFSLVCLYILVCFSGHLC